MVVLQKLGTVKLPDMIHALPKASRPPAMDAFEGDVRDRAVALDGLIVFDALPGRDRHPIRCYQSRRAAAGGAPPRTCGGPPKG